MCIPSDHWTVRRVSTGQGMIRGEIHLGQGNIREFYFESGKIDILKRESGGKEKKRKEKSGKTEIV